ncbi:aminotransferase class V-fold PLP-dependent enzyme [Azospirillum baldaniorum]|uniref:Aminotransferase class V domain-containing protein n=1 Tax=Azospirillum baldaniorum TaxID=1064539 RepID=A0A9P1JPL6_9PROT|nr:aminotransferase class V-fold PLP-dependent enzyme [Azospirillum baldaniorum]AWJ90501.1 aminotransferase class V-fold PLP-dependent enzyme [Azospirillum baldaniorum]TWA78702.1 selenocysteine lyase/cysteine desulfurase [Azospirillum brasilense]CCC97335.1 conserved protein of unknown function [Azospirillum baldaniorum]
MTGNDLRPAGASPLPADILDEELDALRAETPGLAGQTFLLSCGASLMPRPVVERMHGYLDLEARLGGYGAFTASEERLERVYGSIAQLINAAPAEIALVENATVAWQLAFHSLDFTPGDVVITAEAEYGANYVTLLQMQRRRGVVIRVCPSDEQGVVDLTALERMIDPKVRLISLTWVPTNGGLNNPAAAVGQIARAHGIPYLLDACQAVGQMPVDVQTLGCDFLAATSRKFLRGPRGAGFLYVRRAMLDRCEPPFIDHIGARWVERNRYELRDDARRYESWESNHMARLGMGEAADYAMEVGIDRIWRRCRRLAQRLRDGLASVPSFRTHDLGACPSAIVSFSSDAVDPRSIVAGAAARGIVISTSSPESTRLDAERRHLPTLVRAAPHYFNTEADVDQLVAFAGSLIRHGDG